ncbi:MAG: tRNA (adenosine(37)-N6)-threonylcarbamoyltransferase complex ATPase subunit type 1 TsaE [Opitutaceae bacterium]|nr:tRNA (adenosine(37)-N6)-threonylcarbamoyltransferase complex ATPase subunit type 1 TsaE [Opitutaceae bacterium]
MNTFARLLDGVATTSADQMQALAEALASELPRNCTLALHGDLGVGKSTFVRGLARGLGIQQSITSPTFTVFNLHRAPGGLLLMHMDAYRLSGGQAVEALMVDDFLTEPYVLAIEWPNNIADWIPKSAIHLQFSIEPGEVHRVKRI